ncbi:restriction endonuclease [Synechococcus moorigangaii CMS01]|nr:restriction endonuclease [Synechococcus moorigangaii CMS01]
MTIPDYQAIMLPLLKFVGDQKEHSLRETIEVLAEHFQLTEQDRKKLLPSGQQPVFENRVGWSRTHLKKAGLVIYTRRGYFQITDAGQQLLAQNPSEINSKSLLGFPEYIKFVSGNHLKTNSIDRETIAPPEPQTPEEILEEKFRQIQQSLALEILDIVKSCSPSFFESLVIDLLLAMGYGGSRKEAGQVVGKTGDGGIDGIINEDRLGLDVIYIQAKRWEGVVGRPEIQKFVGALQGKRAKKGIFITTSDFTREATEFSKLIESRIILINGESLAQLMIEHNVGTHTSKIYQIKKIDSDYFTE